MTAALAIPIALGGIVVGGPMFMIARATRSAASCLAAIKTPRGPAPQTCSDPLRWLAQASRVPWTRDSASRRAEELIARVAVAAYVDAAVGRPDPSVLASTTGALEAAGATVTAGSKRVAFHELGPAHGAPNLGREAARIGDRRTLLGRAERWTDWNVKVSTLHAALVEGDLQRALEIARHYAEFDPREEDLRTTVAGILCLGSGADASRGVNLLTLVQDDRAARRYAAMARNWGGVRAVIVACAARAAVEPPPKPESSEAGVADLVEVRAAQRVRVAAAPRARASLGPGRNALDGAPAPQTSAATQDRAELHRLALQSVRDLLSAGALEPRSRMALLAVILAEDASLDAASASELASPPPGDEGVSPAELSPGDSPMRRLRAMSPVAYDWLPARGLEEPVVAGPELARAAARAIDLAGADGLAERERAALRAAAGTLAWMAGRELALAGDAPAAIDVVERFGELASEPTSEAERALARSSAWYVAGDRERALASLDDLDGGTTTPAIRAAVLLQRAELLASHGRRSEAARFAVLADDAAAASAGAAAPAWVPLVDARARWMRLALARPPEAAPLRPAPPNEPPSDAPRHAPDAAEPWPWVGFASASAPWMRPEQRAFALALARFSDALTAPVAERRALRYAALGRRGDAPPALIPYADAAAQLLGEGEGDAEVWLDAFLALDARRFSLREHAFARAEAARWRGDARSADAWQRRYEALRAIADDPARAEIARYLGL